MEMNNLQGINSKVGEAKIKSMIWNIRKQKTIKQSNKKKKEFKKREDSIISFWGSFKCSNIRIIGVLEGEEKEKDTGNLFERIMKEIFQGR